jgi:hypothetical protein
MKPTSDQISSLQKYLRKNLKYRETYAEFYDHILTAVEVNSTDASFNDMVMKVVKDDFNGAQGMRSIEDQYRRSAFKELKRKYLNYATDNFRFPGIFITAVFGCLIYFMAKQPWFDLEVFLWNIMAIRAIPAILRFITRITSPRIHGAPTRSIKSDFFKWQNFITFFIFYLGYLVASHSINTNPVWLKELTPTPLMVTILMLLITLHSLTYYKVCRDDIKAALKLT